MTLRIAEVFGLVVQGEGPVIGTPTVFVRAGGCDYRCSWCDSPHAVQSKFRSEWTPMEAPEVLERIAAISGPCLVTLSGGNPAIQPFEELIRLGRKAGYSFACETQGSVFARWFQYLDHLVISPKPPSSGHFPDMHLLDVCCETGEQSHDPTVSLKVVVFNDEDYDFARGIHRRYRDLPFYLQVGNDRPPAEDGSDPGFDLGANIARLRWLMDRVCADRWTDVRVLPQLHVLVHGNERGR